MQPPEDFSFEPDFDEFDFDVSDDFFPLAARKFLSIEVFTDGEIHAKDTQGQIVIVRADGKVRSYLMDDEDWVDGEMTVGPNGQYHEGSAWDVVGFLMGMTNGEKMHRARNGGTTH